MSQSPNSSNSTIYEENIIKSEPSKTPVRELKGAFDNLVSPTITQLIRCPCCNMYHYIIRPYFYCETLKRFY